MSKLDKDLFQVESLHSRLSGVILSDWLATT